MSYDTLNHDTSDLVYVSQLNTLEKMHMQMTIICMKLEPAYINVYYKAPFDPAGNPFMSLLETNATVLWRKLVWLGTYITIVLLQVNDSQRPVLSFL